MKMAKPVSRLSLCTTPPQGVMTSLFTETFRFGDVVTSQSNLFVYLIDFKNDMTKNATGIRSFLFYTRL
jgi:hypothetical protein